MQNNNLTSGNTPGLPALLDYIGLVQNKACRLSGLLSAFAHLEDEKACAEARAAITHIAEELAEEINRDLDSVKLPKVTL